MKRMIVFSERWAEPASDSIPMKGNENRFGAVSNSNGVLDWDAPSLGETMEILDELDRHARKRQRAALFGSFALLLPLAVACFRLIQVFTMS